MMNATRIDCHTHIGADAAFYANGHFPYGQGFRNLVEEALAHGINRLVTFPFVTYYGLEGNIVPPPRLDGFDFSVPYAFENLRMMEEIFVLNEDIASTSIPFVILDPYRRAKEQVESLRKLKERFPIFGLKIQPTIIRAPIRSLLGDGRCITDLAAEWDIPVLIHSSILASDVWSQAQDILDVAEATPGVRFCLAHSCRFDLPSLERLSSLPNTWMDCSAHAIHCDAAVEGLGVVAVPERRLPAEYSDPAQVMKVLADLLPEKTMWGSDAPFYSYAATHDKVTLRLLSTYAREVAALELLSEAQKQAVLRDNTLRFLGREDV